MNLDIVAIGCAAGAFCLLCAAFVLICFQGPSRRDRERMSDRGDRR